MVAMQLTRVLAVLLAACFHAAYGQPPPDILQSSFLLNLASSSTAEATAECSSNTEFCSRFGVCDVCQPGSFPARDALDGNSSTSWQSPPLSAGDQFRPVNFTLDLTERYGLLEISVSAGNSYLPARWTVFRTAGPSSPLVPVATFLPDASLCAGVQEDGVVCGSTTGLPAVLIPDETIPQVLSLHFVFEDPTTPDPVSIGLPPLNANMTQFYSISELFLRVIEPVCLVCLDPLSQQLAEITSLIEDVLDNLSGPGVGEIELDINSTEAAVEVYEDTLTTLEVVLGKQPALPGDTQLSEGVARLDLELAPPIPDKLAQLEALVAMTSDFDFDTSAALLLLETVELRVRELLDNATQFSEEVEELLSGLIALTNQLRADVNSTLEAVAMLREVLSRAYDEIVGLVRGVEGEAGERVGRAEELFETTQDQWNETLGLVAEIELLGQIIEAASVLALATEQQFLLATNQTEEAIVNLDQLIGLISDANVLQRAGQMELEGVAQLLVATEELLDGTRETAVVISTVLLPSLSSLLPVLSDEVAAFASSLSPLRPPVDCDPATANCTAGELQATRLREDADFYVNSSVSVFTLQRARDVVNSIATTGQLPDFAEINAIALSAQNISQQAVDTLSAVDTSNLQAQSRLLQTDAEGLRNDSVVFVVRSQTVIARSGEGLERLEQLSPSLSELTLAVEQVRNSTGFLREQREPIAQELERLAAISNSSQSILFAVDQRVTGLEVGLVDLATAVMETAENVATAEEALDQAEALFPSIEVFLNATQTAASEVMLNISAFVSENSRIVAEIDSLIASLDDIHSRINRVNSPVRLSPSPPALSSSFLSLQPPPGRLIDDSIQFESLDLYLWPGPTYSAPALLFYAGPVYPQGEPTEGLSDEDYFILGAEGAGLAVQWCMSGFSGRVTLPSVSINGFSQIVITRVGSQFALSFGNTIAGLSDPELSTVVQNNSLLFRTSDRTAFLLGGAPSGAQLGPLSSPLPPLSPFRGQVQLLLFNGDQWGVWNIRGASRTDFIGNTEFQRSALASANIWTDPQLLVTHSSLSFSGLRSFLRVERFAEDGEFTGDRGITVVTRSNDESAGLVLYAYDPELMLSLEIAFWRGSLSLVIRAHDGSGQMGQLDMPSTEESVADSPTEGRVLDISYIDNFRIFFVGNTAVVGGLLFFEDLRNVKVWYGGVREDLLESPYVPEITNTSYSGCVDISITKGSTRRAIFMDQFFREQYLNSPVQNGLSATCLQTVYTRQVGLDGSEGAFLSYSHAELSYPPNLDPETPPTTPSQVVSLDFFPATSSGIVMATVDQGDNVTVVIRDGRIEVGVSNGADLVLLQAPEGVSLGAWHSLLVELNTSSTPAEVALFVDGVLQDTTIAPAFNFRLPTSLPGNEQTQLFIGGATPGVFANIDSLPPFTGCLRDFVYNFIAMSFLNSALQLERRYPDGVSYNSCPFSNATRIPLVDVGADQPELRSCLPSPPEELPATHGGFHRDTSLTTSNVIGLLQSSWELSMELKQTADGHVMRLETAQGNVISLTVGGSRVVLSIDSESDTSSPRLEENVFTLVVLRCSVNDSFLNCTLLVGELEMGPVIVITYSGTTFVPNLPIEFGSVNRVGRQSFVGCIRGLAINGDPSGFENVQTEIPCYNVTEPGLGFSGISLLGVGLSEGTDNVSLIFRPLADNGLLLLLSATNTSDPILAVGLVHGQLRVRFNFTETTVDGEAANFFTVTDPPSLCLQNSSGPLNLSLITQSPSDIFLRLEGNGDVASFQLLVSLEGFLSIGNMPADFITPPGSGQFNFLLSGEVDGDGPPPGFVGCVQELSIDGDVVTLQEADQAEEILNGFCPSV